MSKRANRTLIGGFVVGAIAIVIVAILIFGSGKLWKDKAYFVLFFDGTVKGLTIGAPVQFKGTPIGEVRDITLLMESIELKVLNRVLIEVVPGRMKELGPQGTMLAGEPFQENELARLLIRRGLRAKLDISSFLTGQLHVALDFFPDTKVKLTGIETDYFELPTLPSDMEALVRKLEDIPITELVNEALLTVSDLRKLVRSPAITSALSNLDQSMEDISGLISSLDKQMKPLLANLNKAVDDYGKLARNLDSQVGPVMTELKGTLEDARGLVNNVDGRIEPLTGELENTLESATSALDEARVTLATYGDLVDGDSALNHHLNDMLTELAAAARSLRALADQLERHPESLIKGRQ